MLEPTGFALYFNKSVFVAIFAFLGILIGVAISGGSPRGKIPRGEKMPEWAKQPNPTSPTTLFIVSLISGLGAGLLIGWLMGTIIGLGTGLIGAVMAPISINGRSRKKWTEAIDDETLSMLQLLILKLQSGQSLIPALEDIAHNSLTGPLKKEILEFLVGEVAGGASVTQVLARLRDSDRYANTWRLQRVLRHLTTSARAQMSAHKIADRMTVLQGSLVDTYALQLELESELAQAKYSRWIITMMLPLTVFIFNAFSPEIAEKLFITVIGQITLLSVAIMVIGLHLIGGKIAQLPPLEL